MINGSMKLVEINILNNNFVSLVDTGSSHNLLNVEKFKQLKGANFTPLNMRMKVAGSTLHDNVVGKTQILTRFCSKNYISHEINVDYIVAHHTNGYDAIIGASLLFDENIVQAITTQGVIFHSNSGPACVTFTDKSSRANPIHFLTLNSTTLIKRGERTKVEATINPPIFNQNLIDFTANLTISKQQIEILSIILHENSNLALVELINKADYSQTIEKNFHLCTAKLEKISNTAPQILENSKDYILTLFYLR